MERERGWGVLLGRREVHREVWEARPCQGQLPAAKLSTGNCERPGPKLARSGQRNAPSLPPIRGPPFGLKAERGRAEEREASALLSASLRLCLSA